MRDRFPGYDVMSKRGTPSFNEATRRVLDARLAVPDLPRHFSPEEFAAVAAVAARLVPQDGSRPAVPVAGCSRPWAASARRSPSRPSPAAPATASGRWPGAASCSLRPVHAS